MKTKISLDTIYLPSPDIVAREIAGDFIIIPISSGLGDLQEALFTLNGTAKEIWEQLDGTKDLADIIKELRSSHTDTSLEIIKRDVVGLANELLKHKLITKR